MGLRYWTMSHTIEPVVHQPLVFPRVVVQGVVLKSVAVLQDMFMETPERRSRACPRDLQ